MDFVVAKSGVIALVYFVILAFMFNDVIKRQIDWQERIFWILVLYFLPFAGIVLYLIHRRRSG